MTDRQEMEAALEAALFVTSEPLPRKKLLEVFNKSDREEADKALDRVLERYRDGDGRGVVAEQVAGGLRLVTPPALHGYLRRLFEVTGRSRLSMAALETLAIVAYRQPITGPEIQELRGVNSSGVLKTLLERRLVRIAGRKQVVGMPFLYATTREFLMHFGLETLKELPPLEEFEESLGLADDGGAVAPATQSLVEAADDVAAVADSTREDGGDADTGNGEPQEADVVPFAPADGAAEGEPES